MLESGADTGNGQLVEADLEDLEADALGGGLGGEEGNVLAVWVWWGQEGKAPLQKLAGRNPGRLFAGGSPGMGSRQTS